MQARPTLHKPAHVIPFTLRHRHILLDASLNERPATLILDSGSSVTTLDRGWSATLGLEERPLPGGASGVGNVDAALATVERLGIGSLTMPRETVALMPLGNVSDAHGVRIDGTVGFSLFERFVVEVDGAAREIRLYEPAAFAYEGTGTVLSVDLDMRVPVVRATLRAHDGSAEQVRLVLDLGTGGFDALLTAPFGDAHRRWWEARGFERPLGSGAGGTTVGRVCTLESLELGSIEVRTPVVAVAREHAGFLGATWADGTIGAPVLGQGTIVFDYSRRRVIVEGASSARRGASFDASGLDLVSSGAGFERVVVRHVVADSPAADCGVRAGDEITALDGCAVRGADLDRVRGSLALAGETRHVAWRRGGSDFECELRLRALL